MTFQDDDLVEQLRASMLAESPPGDGPDLRTVKRRGAARRLRRRTAMTAGTLAVVGAVGLTASTGLLPDRNDTLSTDLAGPSPGTSSTRPPAATAGPSPTSSSQTTGGGGGQTVVVFFGRSDEGVDACTAVGGVERRIEQTDGIATAAMNELFAGPSASEQKRGFGSLFNEDTAGLLRSVHVEDGTAYLDLDQAFLGINNVSTSCAAGLTLASIEATLTQFPTIEEVRYAVDGDPATFYDFMQIGCPSPRTDGDRCDPAPFQRG